MIPTRPVEFSPRGIISDGIMSRGSLSEGDCVRGILSVGYLSEGHHVQRVSGLRGTMSWECCSAL